MNETIKEEITLKGAIMNEMITEEKNIQKLEVL